MALNAQLDVILKGKWGLKFSSLLHKNGVIWTGAESQHDKRLILSLRIIYVQEAGGIGAQNITAFLYYLAYKSKGGGALKKLQVR